MNNNFTSWDDACKNVRLVDESRFRSLIYASIL